MLSFYDCDKNLSENDFNEVEKKLEVSFPASFKSHYFKWNGGDPNLSCFVNDNIDYDYIEIRDFIPMKYSKQFEDDPDFTLEGRAINEWKLNELPKNLIPFAFDWGGNYLCLEKNSWQIIYYVRDVWSENISREANFKRNSIIIAKSFEEFLNCLEELPSIEPRATAFFVKNNMKKTFEYLFEKYFGKYFYLFTKSEIINMKLFGDGEENKKFRSELGDYIAISYTKKAFIYKGDYPLISQHSGYSDEEVFVPLIVIDTNEVK